MSMPRILIVEDDYRWIEEFRPYDWGDADVERDFASGLKQIESGKEYDYAMFDQTLYPGKISLTFGMVPSNLGVVLACAFQVRFPSKPTVVVTGRIPNGVHDQTPMVKELVSSGCCIHIFKGAPDAMTEVKIFLRGSDRCKNFKVVDHLILQPNFMGLGVDLRSIIEVVLSAIRKRGK